MILASPVGMNTLLGALLVIVVTFPVKVSLIHAGTRIFGFNGSIGTALRAALRELIVSIAFGAAALLLCMAWAPTPSVAMGILCLAFLGAACVAIRTVYDDEDGNWFLAAVFEIGVLAAIGFALGSLLRG